MVYTRNAAKHQIDSSLHALDRAAVYTTSGRQMQEFTGDRQKLHAALDGIGAGAAIADKSQRENSCPPVDYYMGDRIYNKHDLTVWKIATRDAMVCGSLGPSDSAALAAIQEGDVSSCETSGSSDGICKAVKFAKESAHDAVLRGDHDTEASLEMLRAVVSRMASMPGQRNIVLVSPGFLVLDDRHDEQMALTDRAIKANVVIGGLDARGLYSQIQGGDASDHVLSASTNSSDKIPRIRGCGNAHADGRNRHFWPMALAVLSITAPMISTTDSPASPPLPNSATCSPFRPPT